MEWSDRIANPDQASPDWSSLICYYFSQALLGVVGWCDGAG